MGQPGSGLDEVDLIYLRYVSPIRNYLRRLSGDADLADDLVQEVFYRAMRQLWAGVKVRHISAWLYRIARNLYLDHVKRARFLEVPLDEADLRAPGVAPVSSEDPQDAALRREEHDEVARGLLALPEQQRSCLLLRAVEGLAYEEIAEALGMTEGAVKACLHRARRRLDRICSPGSYWIGTGVNWAQAAGYVMLDPLVDTGDGLEPSGGQGFSVPPGAPLDKVYDFSSFIWMPGMRPGS